MRFLVWPRTFASVQAAEDLRFGLEELPPQKARHDRGDVASEYSDIQVTMWTGLATEEKIQGPTAGDPPRHVDIRQQRRCFARFQGTPIH